MGDEPDHCQNASVGATERVLAPATIRAYAADVGAFASWCAERGLPAVPATMSTITVFLMEIADQGRSWSGVRRSAYAILAAHREHGGSKIHGAQVAEILRGVRERTHRVLERTLTEQAQDAELQDVLDYLRRFCERVSGGEARAAIHVVARALQEREHRA